MRIRIEKLNLEYYHYCTEPNIFYYKLMQFISYIIYIIAFCILMYIIYAILFLIERAAYIRLFIIIHYLFTEGIHSYESVKEKNPLLDVMPKYSMRKRIISPYNPSILLYAIQVKHARKIKYTYNHPYTNRARTYTVFFPSSPSFL
jgi:hypothetical protein